MVVGLSLRCAPRIEDNKKNVEGGDGDDQHSEEEDTGRQFKCDHDLVETTKLVDEILDNARRW